MSTPRGALKIATRLALGFGAVIALGVGMVAYAAYALYDLDQHVDELAQNRMVKVAEFGEVRDNMQSIGRYTRNVIIHTDPAFVAEEQKKIAELRAKNSELLTVLDKQIVLPKGRELFTVIKDNRGPYNASLDRAMALAIQGDKEGAGKVLFQETRQLQDLVFKAVDGSRDMQQAIADDLVRRSKASATFGVWLMSGLALLMAVVGGLWPG